MISEVSPLQADTAYTGISRCLLCFKKMILPNLLYGASLVVQLVKNLPTVQETQIRSLGLEDSLEKGMATHSSILAWRIP